MVNAVKTGAFFLYHKYTVDAVFIYELKIQPNRRRETVFSSYNLLFTSILTFHSKTLLSSIKETWIFSGSSKKLNIFSLLDKTT